MSFVRSQIKRAAIPQEDLDDKDIMSVVPDMPPSCIKNAVVSISDDGMVYVTWLQPVIDWRFIAMGSVNAFMFWILLFIIVSVVWDIGLINAKYAFQEWGWI